MSTIAELPTAAARQDDFELDVRVLEMADTAGLVNVTDDNCTSTCGACTTNAA